MSDNILRKLPEGSKKATREDFLLFSGEPKIGMKFILQSMMDNTIYRHYRLGEKMSSIENIMPWINQGMCFISNGNKKLEEEKIKNENIVDDIFKDIELDF